MKQGSWQVMTHECPVLWFLCLSLSSVTWFQSSDGDCDFKASKIWFLAGDVTVPTSIFYIQSVLESTDWNDKESV